MSAGTDHPRKPRGDGLRNRARLLDEAELLFGEQGVNAPLDELARRAEVSSGTLYRHFASRAELIRALEGRVTERTTAAGILVENAATATEGVELFVVLTAQILIEHPASRPVLMAMQQLDPAYQPGAIFEEMVHDLVARAKAEGALSPDVQPADLVMAAIMVSSLGSFTGVRESGLWRRYAAFVLAGLRAGTARAVESAPDDEAYRTILGPDVA